MQKRFLLLICVYLQLALSQTYRFSNEILLDLNNQNSANAARKSVLTTFANVDVLNRKMDQIVMLTRSSNASHDEIGVLELLEIPDRNVKNILKSTAKKTKSNRRTLIDLDKKLSATSIIDKSLRVGNVAAADFDGNSRPDLLITMRTVASTPPASSSSSAPAYYVLICLQQPIGYNLSVADPFHCFFLMRPPTSRSTNQNGDASLTVHHIPMILHWNADMRADIICQTSSGSTGSTGGSTILIFIGQSKAPYLKHSGTIDNAGLGVPVAQLDVDQSGDLRLVFGPATADSPQFKMFSRSTHTGVYDLNATATATSIAIPNKYWQRKPVLIGEPKFGQLFQPSYSSSSTAASAASLRCGGSVQMILPICYTRECTGNPGQSLLMYDFSSGDWLDLLEQLSAEFSFLPGERQDEGAAQHDLIAPQLANIHVVDLNLDGFPDLIMNARRRTRDPPNANQTASQIIVWMKNMRASSMTSKNRLFDAMQPLRDSTASQIENASQISLIDVFQTGVYDLIATMPEHSSANTVAPARTLHQSNIKVFLTNQNVDSFYLKVTVLSPFCTDASSSEDCSSAFASSSTAAVAASLSSFALHGPGVSLCYQTEAVEGGTETALAQLSPQSTFTPLNLPYHIWGLGSFSNYIQKLSVSLPSDPQLKTTRTTTFTFIVPRSQIVISPRPLNQPDKWKAQLFLQPIGTDMTVVYIGVALILIWLIILIVTIVLQAHEIRQDRDESRLDIF